MQGISLDNAKRLQELGVPCAGYPVCSGGDYAPRCEMESGCDEPYYYLCQLLEEVEKREFAWSLYIGVGGFYKCDLWDERDEEYGNYEGATPEDAVAQALIAILEEE